MTSKLSAFGAAALAAALFAAVPGTAIAQQSGQGQAAPDPSTISEADLEAFADAWVEVRGIADSYRGRISQATKGGDQAKAKELSDRANGEMQAAIEDNPDISLSEYRQIVSAAQADKAFASKLRDHLRDAAQETQTQ